MPSRYTLFEHLHGRAPWTSSETFVGGIASASASATATATATAVASRVACKVAVGVAVAVTGAATFADPLDTQATPVQVLYWSAADCGPCRTWREGDRYTEFRQQAQRLGVALVNIRKPSLKDPPASFEWPANVSLHGQLPTSIEPPKGVPHFDILCRGKPVHRLSGLGEWDSFWHSRLRQAVRECQAVLS